MKRLLIATVMALLPTLHTQAIAAGYGEPGATWTLVELNGAPFAARATLSIAENGQVSGQAPCNRFTSSNSVTYPTFDTGPSAATRMACPDLDSEAAFFTALNAMTSADVQGDTLILCGDADGQMVFKASE